MRFVLRKNILVGWGFDPSIIKWDPTEKTLKVENDVKITLYVSEGKFHCEREQSWRERASFFSSTELLDLLKTVGEMVAGTS